MHSKAGKCKQWQLFQLWTHNMNCKALLNAMPITCTKYTNIPFKFTHLCVDGRQYWSLNLFQICWINLVSISLIIIWLWLVSKFQYVKHRNFLLNFAAIAFILGFNLSPTHIYLKGKLQRNPPLRSQENRYQTFNEPLVILVSTLTQFLAIVMRFPVKQIPVAWTPEYSAFILLVITQQNAFKSTFRSLDSTLTTSSNL